jgi:hypothetical protein
MTLIFLENSMEIVRNQAIANWCLVWKREIITYSNGFILERIIHSNKFSEDFESLIIPPANVVWGGI